MQGTSGLTPPFIDLGSAGARHELFRELCRTACDLGKDGQPLSALDVGLQDAGS